jgi:hypothetical protein
MEAVMADKAQELIAYDPALFPRLLDQDPEAVRERFAKRFMAAESIDDLFSVLEGNTTKDLVGRKLRIHGVSWAPFESDRGVIPNAICDAADLDTGEMLEFATTGEQCVLFLRKAELLGVIPFDARIVSKKTRNGYNALNFERI